MGASLPCFGDNETMAHYPTRHILLTVLLLIVISMIVFVMIQFTTIPLTSYARWLRELVHGDRGFSWTVR